MTVYLGLDVGERRIGVARSSGVLATPLTTVLRTSNREAIEALRRLAREEAAEVVIIGIPLGPQGEATPQVDRIRTFGGKVQAHLGVHVVFWDERLTTQTASAALRARRSARKQPPTARQREAARRQLDAAAAAVILQDYLDSRPGMPPNEFGDPEALTDAGRYDG